MYIQPVRQYSNNTNFGNKTLQLDQVARTKIIKNTISNYVHGGCLNDMLSKQPEMLNKILIDTKNMSKSEIEDFVKGLARCVEADFSCNLLPHS